MTRATKVKFMDELERQLRADAKRIQAETSVTLRKRIDAAVAAAGAQQPRKTRPPIRWWSVALIGGAAAMLVVVLLDRPSIDTLTNPPPPTARTVPESPPVQQTDFDLRAQPAVLTEPLEEELEHLKSDLEKAREGVAEDLRGSF